MYLLLCRVTQTPFQFQSLKTLWLISTHNFQPDNRSYSLSNVYIHYRYEKMDVQHWLLCVQSPEKLFYKNICLSDHRATKSVVWQYWFRLEIGHQSYEFGAISWGLHMNNSCQRGDRFQGDQQWTIAGPYRMYARLIYQRLRFISKYWASNGERLQPTAKMCYMGIALWLSTVQ